MVQHIARSSDKKGFPALLYPTAAKSIDGYLPIGLKVLAEGIDLFPSR